MYQFNKNVVKQSMPASMFGSQNPGKVWLRIMVIYWERLILDVAISYKL